MDDGDRYDPGVGDPRDRGRRPAGTSSRWVGIALLAFAALQALEQLCGEAEGVRARLARLRDAVAAQLAAQGQTPNHPRQQTDGV